MGVKLQKSGLSLASSILSLEFSTTQYHVPSSASPGSLAFPRDLLSTSDSSLAGDIILQNENKLIRP